MDYDKKPLNPPQGDLISAEDETVLDAAAEVMRRLARAIADANPTVESFRVVMDCRYDYNWGVPEDLKKDARVQYRIEPVDGYKFRAYGKTLREAVADVTSEPPAEAYRKQASRYREKAKEMDAKAKRVERGEDAVEED